MNRSTLRIYGLSNNNIVLLDMTTASSNGLVSEDGIIQFGNSKDNPTRPQIKIVLSVLDILGLPLTVNVVPGNCADDPLSIPAMDQVQKSPKYRAYFMSEIVKWVQLQLDYIL